MSDLVPNEHPPQTTRGRLDDVPGIERVVHRVPETPVPPSGQGEGGGRAVLDAVAAARVGRGAVFEGVGFPVEGEDVEDGEEGHFDDQQHGGQADVDVWVA